MPYDNVYSEKQPPGTLRITWRKFYSDTPAMIGLYGCGLLALCCLFGPLFAPYGIDQQFLGYQLLPPSWSRFPGSDLPCDSQHGNDHANFCSSSCGRLG